VSFDSLEKTIRETDAVTNYEALKATKQDIENELIRVKQESSERDRRYISRIKTLENRVEELEKCSIRYRRKSYSPEEFRREVLKGVVAECQNKVDQGINDKWLKEAPQRTAAALKKDISNYPNCSPETYHAIESAAMKQADIILQDEAKWPAWFKEKVDNIINKGIRHGLDTAFNSRVDIKATEELNRRINYTWPQYIAKNVTALFQGTLREQLNRLSEPILVKCDRCGTEYELWLTPENISSLIIGQQILIKCSNLQCKSLWWWHTFPLSLGQVIYYLTTRKTV
jgi:hypothetical protein